MAAPAREIEPGLESDIRIMAMHSYHLGKQIDLEACARAFVDRLRANTKLEMSLRLGDGVVHLFSFGSAVFIDVEPTQVEVFLGELKPFVQDPGSTTVTDDYLMEVRPGAREAVSFDRVILSEATPQKLHIAAMVLAQSTTLEHFEETVERLLQKAATVTEGMAEGGRVPLGLKEMIQFIGVGLSTRRQVVSRLSILDAPEQAWQDSALDRLFHELKTNFELSTRFRSLEYKLRLIHEAVEVIVDLTQTRRATILEVTIVVLIFVEIVMAFFK